MKKMIIATFIASVIASGISGCRSVPLSERSQLLLTTASYENGLGLTAYDEYKQKFPRSTNQEYIDALNRVGKAISRVAEQDDFEWEFIVLESSTANAFCLPGGKVAFYTGIFKYMKNDAELACVVAHEVAHAIARHSGERISWSKLQSLGTWVLSSTLQNETINAVYGIGSQFGVMLPFSRSNETEADLIGLTLMAKAGYNPRAAVAFWKRFGAGKEQSMIEKWSSTHPSGEDRIADLENKMSDVEEIYRQAKIKRGYGETFVQTSQ